MDDLTLLAALDNGDYMDNNYLLSSILLPKKESDYSLQEIEQRQKTIHDNIEKLQRQHNDKIDKIVLDNETKSALLDIPKTLHSMHLEMMKLQCEIAFTREQFETVRALNDNPLVIKRRNILMKEKSLIDSLHHQKFETLKVFLDKYSNYLNLVINECKKLIAKQASGYLQFFDWSHYQHTISLLRACGKVLSDIERFQRLYQHDLDFSGMKFKQPIEKMEFNNFIDFPDSYSLETQLEIFIRPGQKLNFKEWKSDSTLGPIFTSTILNEWSYFEPDYLKFKNITIECCRLLVDIHMSYIEAHLTTGINVDKLNEVESSSSLNPDEQEQPLPCYALSPQEYIINIGQHLLTLIKQSEQLDTITDNDSLILALKFAKETSGVHIDIQAHSSVTEAIMKGIASHCIRSFLGRTGASIMSKLTQTGKRQLAADVLYLNNVMEDLGLLDQYDPNVDKFKRLCAT